MTDEEIVQRAKDAEKRTAFGELVHSPVSRGVNSAYGIGFIEGMVEYRNSLQAEPVSKDLEEEVKKLWQEINTGHEYSVLDSYNVLYGICLDIANWQKEQFEKNRLKHCNSITNEQAELEQGFIDQHLDKHQRMPTFLDAIEYGMSLKEKEMQSTIELAEDHAMLAGMEKMKEQMMKGAFECEVKADTSGYPDIPLIELYDYDKDEPLASEGDKVKVIVIKED